ncbi:uncharacterized protein TrAtP1_006506 [Trichoderma atroviride]|uniref:uncharacterized protein n=1 Tax=Hypocrea atroviridis TaxID=63577 RepID=UPI00332D75C8|nr:hypothetical protein TrAtP1_006506 [Trichoderma atroviride]
MYSLLVVLPNRPQYASRYSGNTALETSASQPHKARLHPQRAPSELLERFPQRASLAQAPATAIEHSAATGPAHSVHCAEPVAHAPSAQRPTCCKAAGSSRSPGALVQRWYPVPRGRAGSHAADRYWRPSRPRPGFLMVNEWNGARRSLTHLQAAARIARPLFS